MSFLFTQQQCFIIAIIAFGLIGFYRGWRREVVSLAFALTGVLFLLLNGGDALAKLVFVKAPVIFHDLVSTSTMTTPPNPDPNTVLIVTLVSFVVIVVAGYLIGNKVFKDQGGKKATPADRLLGVIPGLITGYFLITYIANTFAKNPLITVGFGTPTQNVITTYVPLLIIAAIVLVVIGLILSRRKPSAPAKKG